MHLYKSKLEEKVNMTTPTDGDIARATKLGTVNLPIQLLFQSVLMMIVDKEVTESNNFYP